MDVVEHLNQYRNLKWGDPRYDGDPDDKDAPRIYLCAVAADEITRLREFRRNVQTAVENCDTYDQLEAALFELLEGDGE